MSLITDFVQLIISNSSNFIKNAAWANAASILGGNVSGAITLLTQEKSASTIAKSFLSFVSGTLCVFFPQLSIPLAVIDISSFAVEMRKIQYSTFCRIVYKEFKDPDQAFKLKLVDYLMLNQDTY